MDVHEPSFEEVAADVMCSFRQMQTSQSLQPDPAILRHAMQELLP